MGNVAQLTPREREVMELVARRRLSSKEAAADLGITHKRVDEICVSVRDKLGARDRREAALIFLGELSAEPSTTGLVDPRVEPGRGPTRVDKLPFVSSTPSVSEDTTRADAYDTAPQPDSRTAQEHAERRRSLGPHLEALGTSFPGDRLPSEQTLGCGFCDGSLDGQQPALAREPGLPPRGAHAGEHPDRVDLVGRPWVLSWIIGRARFSELNPLQRFLGILVLTGLLGVVGGWIVEGSQRAVQLLGPLVGH